MRKRWKRRMLTGIVGGGSGPLSLLTSLVAYWKLDEESGSRVDSVSGMVLTDNNTVTQATGKVGSAAQFTSANSEYLSIADNTTLSLSGDFTIALWAYPDTLTGTTWPITKWDASGSNSEYALRYSGGLTFFVRKSDNSATVSVAGGALSTAAWAFIVIWHNSTAQTINIQVNNGTAQSAANTGDVRDSTNAFRLGALGGTAAEFWNGRIDEVGVWKRVLTTSERTALYNGGNGTTYPF